MKLSESQKLAAAYFLGRLSRSDVLIGPLFSMIRTANRSKWDVAEAQSLYDKIVATVGLSDAGRLLELGLLALEIGVEAPDLARRAADAYQDDVSGIVWRVFEANLERQRQESDYTDSVKS